MKERIEMNITTWAKNFFTKERLFSRKAFFIYLLLIDLYITLYTVLKASSFSFMITDDYYDAVLVRDMFEGSLLLRTLKVVYYRYMTHTGAFTCFFTLYFRLGLIANNEALLPIFIAADILLLVISLYLFINCLCNYIGMHDHTLKFCLFSGIIIPWFSYYSYNQVFFWFTSCNAYCLGLAMLLFTLAAFLKLCYKPNFKFLILTSIIAIICGGIYIIFTPVMVLFVVLLNLTELIRHKKINIRLLIVSVLLAISTLINIIAPGYQLRRVDEVKISATEAFKLAMNGTFHNEIPNILKNPSFLIFCIAAVYCGIRFRGRLKINGIRLLLSFALTIIMMILSCFPVYLGYAYDSFDKIQNRCIFTIDFFSYTSIILLAFAFGIYLQQWSEITVSKKLNVAVIMVLSLLVVTNYTNIFLSNARYDLIDQTNHNNINYYRMRVQETIDMIKNSPDADVVVPLLPDVPSTINPFNLSDDPTIWINEAVAQYYYKNSVRSE